MKTSQFKSKRNELLAEICEVDESEGARNERNTEAKETVKRQKLCMVVRTCKRNESYVIKNCNQLDKNWKASSEHTKIR